MRCVAALVLAAACACGRAPASAAVEPVTVADGDVDAGLTDPDARAVAGDPDAAADTAVAVANVGGGLWVVDGAGQAVGVLIGRGFPSPASSGAPDVLRDAALVYSPKAGVFFAVQMSSGKVIAPRIGVSDTTCTGVAVAGYYGSSDGAISGQGYAFVYQDTWYRIDDYKPAALVTCGGTVQDGVDGKCSPHAGSCVGFPVHTISPSLPTVFPAPLAFSWLAK